jgi:hypothetical protein
MKKLIVKIGGGLGNQLFTYAAAKRLADSNFAELVIDHVSGFENDSLYKRVYMLDWFNIHDRKATWWERQPNGRILGRGLRSLFKTTQFNNRKFIFQETIHFDSRLLDLKLKHKCTYFQGYWQSENYFKDIESDIRDYLSFKISNFSYEDDIIRQMSNSNSVSLHVRFFEDKLGADYTVDEQYYLSAMRYISDQLINPTFYIFSDKPILLNSLLEKCKSYNYQLIDLSKFRIKKIDLAEFELMSICKHKIIANSTYSWWAAWLGNYKEKIVIAPRFKYIDGMCAWGFEGLIPSDWVLI